MSLWPRRATRIHNPTLQSLPPQPPRSFWLPWVIALRGLVATCLTRTPSAAALQMISFAFSGSFLRPLCSCGLVSISLPESWQGVALVIARKQLPEEIGGETKEAVRDGIQEPQ